MPKGFRPSHRSPRDRRRVPVADLAVIALIVLAVVVTVVVEHEVVRLDQRPAGRRAHATHKPVVSSEMAEGMPLAELAFAKTVLCHCSEIDHIESLRIPLQQLLAQRLLRKAEQVGRPCLIAPGIFHRIFDEGPLDPTHPCPQCESFSPLPTAVVALRQV